MKAEHQLDLPRRLQIEFSRVVQVATDDEGGEVTAAEMWAKFSAEYLAPGPVALLGHRASSVVESKHVLTAEVSVDGEARQIEGSGNGPISAFCDARGAAGVKVRVLDYTEHALSGGSEVSVDGEARQIEGSGNGPISAFCDALGAAGVKVRVLDYTEHALSAGSDAQAAAYVECDIDGRMLWGVGVDADTTGASMRAVLSAVNRTR